MQGKIGDSMKRAWLINIRKSKQLTQQYVAANSYIDRSYYSHIESGKRNPSLTVANNIAAVLNFDPLIFFKNDQINNPPENTNLKLDIDELLSKMETGNILYLYNKFNSYIHNAVIFSLLGVWKNGSCFIIDTPMNFFEIQKNLENFLSNNEMKNHIHHINKEEIMNQTPESLSSNPINILSTKLEEKTSIFIWCHVHRDHPNDWVFKLQNQLNSNGLLENNKKIVKVHAYDASIVSAQIQIELMRLVPYLMTDKELVDSPLYHSGEKTTIFPSLCMQEDK